MKHALSAPFALALLLAGCASDQEFASYEMHSTASQGSALPAPSGATGSLPAAKPRQTPEAEPNPRHERQVYAQGLEKILLANGVNVSVVVYEGKADPTPTLMFIGHFSREFVERAVTNGAVLQRAKELGFKSVDFFDRGPDGHYQFVLSMTGPLPKCAAYNRLCL
jgi:hypothetical protein